MTRNEARLDPQIVEAEENFLIDLQFLVQDLINSKRMTRAELARKAGISKARLSQILSAEANPTAKTFARLFHALGAKVALKYVPEHREYILPTNKDRSALWKVEQAAAPTLVEARRVKNKEKIEWLADWRRASNDNYVAAAGDAETLVA